jgi:hypothetical protein
MKKITLPKFLLHLSVIFLIIVLIFVLIDPEKLMHIQRNKTRLADINQILTSIKDYKEKNGQLYMEIQKINTGSIHVIGLCTEKGETGCGAKTTHEKCIDLTGLMSEVPKDPFSGSDLKTDYYLRKNEDETITVGVCDSEAEGRFGGGERPEIEIK